LRKVPQTSSGKTTDQQVTVAGCVEKETDYRRAHDKGRAGVVAQALARTTSLFSPA
jgi:hypothetical protein